MKGATKLILILIALFLALATYAQENKRYVILIDGDRVYVDMGYMDGVRKGRTSRASSSTRWWAYGGGLFLTVAALYFNHSASVQYDRYASARDPEDISRYRNAYNREITKARVSAILAGAIVVGYLLRHQMGPSNSKISALIATEGEDDMGVIVKIGGVRWFGAR